LNLMQPSASPVEYRISSSLWCKSIAIDREENYVVVGFENATVRFFSARSIEQPREDRLHAPYHQECKACPSVDTLAFSNDGLALLASTRSPKTGLIQIYSWRFPFHTFQELASCRYAVPLHESEDNGVSSAIFRPGVNGEENLVCITTWTQSGTPMLIQPQDGHRSEVRTDVSSKQSKLGSRIQCAAFSPSGRELVMVNDKGHVFQVSNLNSSPMDVRRIASSKELTAKSDSFAMAFMSLSDEEHVVLAWADSARATGWVKKIPITSRVGAINAQTSSFCCSLYGWH
jgi:WD40 repeat protein